MTQGSWMLLFASSEFGSCGHTTVRKSIHARGCQPTCSAALPQRWGGAQSQKTGTKHPVCSQQPRVSTALVPSYRGDTTPHRHCQGE